MVDENILLQPVDDNLPMRDSKDYARTKLKALQVYLEIFTNSMKNKNWSGFYFLDLQSGPGKNRIGQDVLLGSPLIALNLQTPFTFYRFNEKDQRLAEALRTRVQASPYPDRVQIHQSDVNDIVHTICDEIDEYDKSSKPGQWPSLNVAFLDPEGLELHWSSVERLARVNRMDLIINFSTGGINRLAGSKDYELIHAFFGNDGWLEDMKLSTPQQRRRALITRYLNQLKRFGYYVEESPELEHHDISFRNTKGAEVYSLIFASKHPLGDRFWRQSRKSSSPPRLPGF